jgi:hypothetical protein
LLLDDPIRFVSGKSKEKLKSYTEGDKEDKLFESKSGRYFTGHEDWPPAEPERQ